MVRVAGTGHSWAVGSGATLTGSAPAGAFTPAIVPVQVNPAQAIDTPVILYAVSNSAGVIHVTPTSTLVTNRLTAQRAQASFANLGKPGTTIATALTPMLLASAQSAVKQTLAQAGLPAALVDDPTAPSLVPVNLTTTYQKLVSGDVLSAAGTLLAAVTDNAINYGCGGEAYGIMPDDGLPRPSCLAGANVEQSWLLTTFIGVDLPRSLDIETRATELAGDAGPGGGWKFQSTRLGALPRRALVQGKIVTALQAAAGSSPLKGTAGEVLERLRNWDTATWDSVNTKLCDSLSASDLSDLTYSYLELKLSMKPGPATQTEDAASALGLGGAIKSTAVNRVRPLSFADGNMVKACPVVTANASRLRELVGAYQLAASRPSIATLLAAIETGLTAWLGHSLAERADLNGAGLLIAKPFLEFDVEYFYGRLGSDQNDPLLKLLKNARFCADKGIDSALCRESAYSPDQFRADIATLAAMVPAADAAGNAGGTQSAASVALADLGNQAAEFFMNEYEQHFDKYFDAHTSYSIIDASGFALFQWALDNPERDASIAIPDVSEAGLKVNGSQLELAGQFNIRRVDVHLPAFKTEKLLGAELRLTPVRVSAGQYPVTALCDSADLACMGRLRRTRHFTQSAVAMPLSGTATSVNVGWLFWDIYKGSMNLHDEVIPYNSGHIELFSTLKNQ